MTTKVILTLIVPVYQGLYFAPIYKIFIYIPYKHENKLCKSSAKMFVNWYTEKNVFERVLGCLDVVGKLVSFFTFSICNNKI
jgi:hypothetical protein